MPDFFVYNDEKHLKMIEITLADIAANNCKRNELKSEAIKLGRIVAQKKREFLKNKGW